MLEKYDLLDGFKYQLEKRDFFNKYRLFGYPKQIHDAIGEIRVANLEKKSDYKEVMQNEQSIFGQSEIFTKNEKTLLL